MIDPTFRNINSNNNPTRIFFIMYYMPLVEIKDFNVLIDNNS